ncbi:SWIRM domain protein [Aspergillus californicus]
MTYIPATSPLVPSDKPNMGCLHTVSNLMSPPESKPFDSFNPTFLPHRLSQDPSYSREMQLAPMRLDRKRTQSEMDLPSPPVTPYAGNKKSKSVTSEQQDGDAMIGSSRDPVLFPRHDESISEFATDEPLIGSMIASEEDVEQHIDSHMARFKNKHNKPTRDEYRLALSCVPIVSTQYNRDPKAWLREETKNTNRLIMLNQHRPQVSDGGLKRIAPAPTKRVVPAQTRVQRTPRVKRTPKSTPKQKALDSFELHTPNSRSSRAIGTSRDDTDFESIKDYSPSQELIGGNAKSLKTDWKGQMLDLSNDPERHLLSPPELNIAATLRLSCATYLCSKRRIFEARVKALSVGKEFRKTDAQQACKIDVNKASKLWTAYERVGLFSSKYFQQYL